jgi:hypothetical protein
MLKKVLIGTVFVGLIGALIAGAVIRTTDRVDKVAETAERQGRDVGEDAIQGNGGRWQSSDEDRGEASNGRGGGGNGSGGREEALDELDAGQAEVDEWITLEGTVDSVDEDNVIVVTADGEFVTVEDRPWSFAQEEGFSVERGDQVRLTGFYEDGKLEVGAMDNLTAGTSVQMREEGGRPLWAGRRRRGGA